MEMEGELDLAPRVKEVDVDDAVAICEGQAEQRVSDSRRTAEIRHDDESTRHRSESATASGV